MSKLKVTTISDPDNDNTALTIDSSGNVTASQGFVPSTQLSHRNIMINGAMQVAQRGTSFTNPTDQYTLDRWAFSNSNFGAWNVTQSTDAPEGFKYSLKATCTTADSSPASGDYVFVRCKHERQNIEHLKMGTSNALSFTLSFWVKSNKTGTFGIEHQVTGSKETSADVTINTADTWEYKTVSIPANTSYAQSEPDTGNGLSTWFWINAGSNYQGTPPSNWADQTSGRAGTLTSDIGNAVNDYFAFTGVQLEVGSVATPFEHRSYGEELARCQRYYYMHTTEDGDNAISLGYMWSNSELGTVIQFPVTMRAAPSLSKGNGTNWYRFERDGASNGWDGFTGLARPGKNNAYVYTQSASFTQGQVGELRLVNSGAYVAFDAEL